VTLRTKLLLAQVPVGLALVVVGATTAAASLGDAPELALAGVVAATVLAVTAFSGWLTARLVRPLAALSAAARRIGDGDLDVRAPVAGNDELAALATELNTMAERLRRYRTSSLGELLQAQRALQAAIDSLPDPVLVLDASGAVVDLNGAAEALFRRGAGAAPSIDALDPALRATIDRVRAHVLGGKGSYVPRGFEEAVTVEGTEGTRRLLPRASPLCSDEGVVIGSSVVLQDVTRLLRFDELKNDLVSTVAHEFRTPLTSLRMAVHLCADELVGPITEKQADLLFAARQDCERLQTTVDDLLDLTRLQAGRLELTFAPAAPLELACAALDAHRSEASAAGIELESPVTEALPEVLVDRERIDLVLSNLVGNAIKYTPRGGRVAVAAAVAEDGFFRFEVHDSGPGVPPEFHARVFDKFFRVPGVSASGVGLGLYIARDVVQAHGGRIGVESAPGQGSRFWFTVRRADVAPGEEARAAPTAGT
jgi:two-component system, NtrC family, sensor histidine kinase KinB